MDLKKLKEVKDWAQDKINSNSEPPWAWYQYMKLIETLNAIIKGQESVSPIAKVYPKLKPVDENFNPEEQRTLEIDLPM